MPPPSLTRSLSPSHVASSSPSSALSTRDGKNNNRHNIQRLKEATSWLPAVWAYRHDLIAWRRPLHNLASVPVAWAACFRPRPALVLFLVWRAAVALRRLLRANVVEYLGPDLGELLLESPGRGAALFLLGGGGGGGGGGGNGPGGVFGADEGDDDDEDDDEGDDSDGEEGGGAGGGNGGRGGGPLAAGDATDDEDGGGGGYGGERLYAAARGPNASSLWGGAGGAGAAGGGRAGGGGGGAGQAAAAAAAAAAVALFRPRHLQRLRSLQRRYEQLLRISLAVQNRTDDIASAFERLRAVVDGTDPSAALLFFGAALAAALLCYALSPGAVIFCWWCWEVLRPVSWRGPPGIKGPMAFIANLPSRSLENL